MLSFVLYIITFVPTRKLKQFILFFKPDFDKNCIFRVLEVYG